MSLEHEYMILNKPTSCCVSTSLLYNCGHAIQEYESNQFKSYFKSGIQILEGGVASGLNHVNINDKTPKLFIVKGKRQPMIRDLFLPLFIESQFFKHYEKKFTKNILNKFTKF